MLMSSDCMLMSSDCMLPIEEESWRLHVLTIAIFGLPTAAVLLYIHSRPDLSRTLCLV